MTKEAPIRNWRLIKARREQSYWPTSLAETERKIGLRSGSLAKYESGEVFPTQNTQERICRFYGLRRELVFPDYMSPRERKKEIVPKLVDIANINESELPIVEEPYRAIAEHELNRRIWQALNTLTEREQRVLNYRFGLEDGIPRSLEEVGKEFDTTRHRIRQIEAKALRKLRHPRRMRLLEGQLD